MIRNVIGLLVLAVLTSAMLLNTRAFSTTDDATSAVAATLDAFHQAASRADAERYFGLFADDGVFLGTDASERWTLDEFKAYAKPYFDQGRGWTYTPVQGHRFITTSDDGSIAWFDELLTNEKYGMCRGSGVLRRTANGWRIAQYTLAFMIPNDKAMDVVTLIKAKQP